VQSALFDRRLRRAEKAVHNAREVRGGFHLA
jgi:hypothetical protein